MSGLAMIAPNGTWLDVQAVTIDGHENVRVRRYRRVDNDRASVRAIAGSPLSLDAVKDASEKVSPMALEAALVESNAGYDLTARKVIDLDDAGVPDSVIDVLIALSYPEKFVVERTSRATGTSTFINDPFSLGWSYYHPAWFADFYYSPYGYGYSPYAYGPYSPFGALYLYDNGAFFPGGLGGSSPEPQPSGDGRVVDGLGYTRVRPRPSEPAVQNGGGTRGTQSASGNAGPAPASSSGATSGGGYGAGSSSSDTGRTAQPR